MLADGSWHPPFVHFPIALLLTGIAFAFLYALRPRPAWQTVAWHLLTLGWFSLFPAGLTGLIDQGRIAPDHPLIDVLNQHITLGIALIVVFGLVLYMRLRRPDILDDPRARRPVLALLLLGGVLILGSGWTGGILSPIRFESL